MSDHRRQKRTSRLSIAISAALHAVIIGVLIFVAAREGILGKQLRKLAVTMVPPEKPPEKPKEKPPEPKPEPAPPKESTPPPASALHPEIVKAAPAPPPAESVAPSAAPPAATLPSFDFDGGRTVESSSDPLEIYKGYLEYTLHSHWTRPDGVADTGYVADVELEVSPDGHILGYEWQKGSGNHEWDESVRRAIAATPSLDRPPPQGFPDKVLVRFDVVPTEELGE